MMSSRFLCDKDLSPQCVQARRGMCQYTQEGLEKDTRTQAYPPGNYIPFALGLNVFIGMKQQDDTCFMVSNYTPFFFYNRRW
jgi:hypothetical protein